MLTSFRGRPNPYAEVKAVNVKKTKDFRKGTEKKANREKSLGRLKSMNSKEALSTSVDAAYSFTEAISSSAPSSTTATSSSPTESLLPPVKETSSKIDFTFPNHLKTASREEKLVFLQKHVGSKQQVLRGEKAITISGWTKRDLEKFESKAGVKLTVKIKKTMLRNKRAMLKEKNHQKKAARKQQREENMKDSNGKQVQAEDRNDNGNENNGIDVSENNIYQNEVLFETSLPRKRRGFLTTKSNLARLWRGAFMKARKLVLQYPSLTNTMKSVRDTNYDSSEDVDIDDTNISEHAKALLKGLKDHINEFCESEQEGDHPMKGLVKSQVEAAAKLASRIYQIARDELNERDFRNRGRQRYLNIWSEFKETEAYFRRLKKEKEALHENMKVTSKANENMKVTSKANENMDGTVEANGNMDAPDEIQVRSNGESSYSLTNSDSEEQTEWSGISSGTNESNRVSSVELNSAVELDKVTSKVASKSTNLIKPVENNVIRKILIRSLASKDEELSQEESDKEDGEESESDEFHHETANLPSKLLEPPSLDFLFKAWVKHEIRTILMKKFGEKYKNLEPPAAYEMYLRRNVSNKQVKEDVEYEDNLLGKYTNEEVYKTMKEAREYLAEHGCGELSAKYKAIIESTAMDRVDDKIPVQADGSNIDNEIHSNGIDVNDITSLIRRMKSSIKKGKAMLATFVKKNFVEKNIDAIVNNIGEPIDDAIVNNIGEPITAKGVQHSVTVKEVDKKPVVDAISKDLKPTTTHQLDLNLKSSFIPTSKIDLDTIDLDKIDYKDTEDFLKEFLGEDFDEGEVQFRIKNDFDFKGLEARDEDEMILLRQNARVPVFTRSLPTLSQTLKTIPEDEELKEETQSSSSEALEEGVEGRIKQAGEMESESETEDYDELDEFLEMDDEELKIYIPLIEEIINRPSKKRRVEK